MNSPFNPHNKPHSQLVTAQGSGATTQASTEMQELGKEIGKMVFTAVAEALLPLEERVALAEKRKVVANRYGEVVANALSGDALREMYKQCGPLSADLSNLPAE